MARFALVPLSLGGCFWFATLNRDTVERALARFLWNADPSMISRLIRAWGDSVRERAISPFDQNFPFPGHSEGEARSTT